MRRPFFRIGTASILFAALMLAPQLRAQDETAKLYKTNCVICHAADGSGSTSAGKALQAKDLRSKEAQAKSDADLSLVINKGKGKMPAFGAKLKPDEIKQMVAFVRQIGKAK